jgi:hypothetical protein
MNKNVTSRLPDVLSPDIGDLAGIVQKDDFVNIGGKIEIKRDLALKLFSLSKLSYEVSMLPARIIGDEMIYYAKAKVFLNDSSRTIASLGSCTTKEIDCKGGREHHDALARAETRAFKRALEMAVGLPVINQIIERVYSSNGNGSNSSGQKKNGHPRKNVALQPGYKKVEPGFIVKEIYAADSITDLNMIIDRYKNSFDSYPEKVKDAVYAAKELRVKKLRSGKRGKDLFDNIDDGIDLDKEQRDAERVGESGYEEPEMKSVG